MCHVLGVTFHMLGAVQVLHNHLEGGRGQAKVLQLITIYRGGRGGELLHCKKVCRLLACMILGLKKPDIGKKKKLKKTKKHCNFIAPCHSQNCFTVFSSNPKIALCYQIYKRYL